MQFAGYAVSVIIFNMMSEKELLGNIDTARMESRMSMNEGIDPGSTANKLSPIRKKYCSIEGGKLDLRAIDIV